jgi:hypothetical protein
MKFSGMSLSAFLVLFMASVFSNASIIPKYSNFDTTGDFDGWTNTGAVKDANGINGTECVRLSNQNWMSLDFSADTPYYKTLSLSVYIYEPSENVTKNSESIGILLQSAGTATGPTVTFSNVGGVRYVGYKVGTTFHPITPAILNKWVEIKIQADCDANHFSFTYDGIDYKDTGNIGFPFSKALTRINMVMFNNPNAATGTWNRLDNVRVAKSFSYLLPKYDNFNSIGYFSGWQGSGMPQKVTSPIVGTTGEAVNIQSGSWLWLDLNPDALPYNHITWTMQLYEPSSNIGHGRSLNLLLQSTNVTGMSLKIDDVDGVRMLQSTTNGVWTSICPIITDQYVELKLEGDIGNPTVNGSGNPPSGTRGYTVATYNSVRYDNGGQGYAFMDNVPKIQKVMYSNANYDYITQTYVDNVKVVFSSEPMVPSCSNFNSRGFDAHDVNCFDSWFYESGAFKTTSPTRDGSLAIVIQKASWLYKNLAIDSNVYTNIKLSAWTYEPATNVGRSVNILVQNRNVATGLTLAFDNYGGARYLGYLANGSTFTPITPAVTNQYVVLVLEADAALEKGKFAVTYDGIRYDNLGRNYDFSTKLYKIDQIMFANTSYTGNETFYIDDVCLDVLHPVNCGDLGMAYNSSDYNHDCIVNFKDMALFAESWMEKCSRTACTDPVECTYPIIQTNSNPQLMYLKADLNQDTNVDSYDLKDFVEQWLSRTDL